MLQKSIGKYREFEGEMVSNICHFGPFCGVENVVAIGLDAGIVADSPWGYLAIVVDDEARPFERPSFRTPRRFRIA